MTVTVPTTVVEMPGRDEDRLVHAYSRALQAAGFDTDTTAMHLGDLAQAARLHESELEERSEVEEMDELGGEG